METAAEAVSQALQTVPSKTGANAESAKRPILGARLAAHLWARMIARYGHRWTSQFGNAPEGLAGAEWRETIGTAEPAALKEAFRLDALRGDGWPPSSTLFAFLCRPEESDAPRTYLGSAPAKRQFTAIESERSRKVAHRELSKMCDQLGIAPDSLAGKST